MRLLKQAAMFAALMFGLVTVTSELTMIQQVVTALVPDFGLFITALVGWGVAMLKAKTGIDIEARHREALQSALMNGVLYALQKAGWVPGNVISQAILSTARGYVESSVPEALQTFGIDPATAAGKAALDRLLTPKLPVVLPNGDTLIGRAK